MFSFATTTVLCFSGKYSDLEISKEDIPTDTSYDRLDFTRPTADLKPHYHSTSTLRSVKSTSKSRECFEQDVSRIPTGSYIQTALYTDPSSRRFSSEHRVIYI